MIQNCHFLRSLAILAVVATTAPAWGQRIRFAQPQLDEEIARPEEPKVAAQVPLKAKSPSPADARPPAPAARGDVWEDVPLAAGSPLSRPMLPGEIVETPPPYFFETEPAYPMYDYAPHSEWGYGPLFSPRRYSLWTQGWSLNGCMEGFSPLRGAGAFGEFLYLRPRDTEIAFAVPGQAPVVMGGVPTVAVPQGSTLTLDPDYAAGFRAGVFVPLQPCVSLQVAYAQLETDAQNAGALTADQIQQNTALFPLLLHPRTALPNNVTNVSAQGQLGVDFKLLDADARVVFFDQQGFRLVGYGGARWAELEQNLQVAYTINGGTVVQSTSSYEGVGPRLGLDGSGSLGCWGFGYYARSDVSFLFGSAKGSYQQFQINNAANPQVFTDWKADRISPVYELELGFQWVGPKKHVRLSVGYLMSVWFNVITTEEVVQGIQANQFDDLSDTMTFDGLTARAEFRL